MSKTFVFNTTDSPVLADSDGHTIGGGEWGWADGAPLNSGLDTGVLVEADKPGKDADPTAVEAFAAGDDAKTTRRASTPASDKE